MAEAYVSLTTNDDYGHGAYVLGKSLRNTSTSKKLVLMVTKGVSGGQRKNLQTVWDELVDIEELDSGDKESLALLERPELGCTFSKIRAWKLTEYQKCVFMDADTLVLQNVDDLFEREEISAVSDVGWPDCFNSGVFVFKPSETTYAGLLDHAKRYGSFDGGDQGLLNDFFSNWSTSDISHRLPFTYNTVSSAVYSYAPAFNRYGKDIKIIHFLGSVKPWHNYFDQSSGKVQYSSSQVTGSDKIFIQMWWEIFHDNMDSWKYWQQGRQVVGDRRECWESGTPDYQGQDRFDNIMTYMSAMMLSSQPTPRGDSS